MTQNGATAYAGVAYRIMEYEGLEKSEEYLSIVMEILYQYYTEKEIQKIYLDNIIFDSYDAIINDEKIKKGE